MQQIGRYRVLGELGRGAMGVVYRALDPAIGRTVAVKTVQFGAISDPSEHARLRERLLREAQSAGGLSHPGIVTIYDILEQADTVYIFMEFVSGSTLEKRLASPDPLAKDLLFRVLRETAEALDYAHRKGIIHRDIKPANIMIADDGRTKIMDFGVAKISSHQMTQAGTILGTPSYMAPEQIEGRVVDGRADQFSLGVIVYEAFTGEKPFAADSLPTLLFKLVREDPVPPERVNPTLNGQIGAVILRALAKSPDQRYESCTEFIRVLSEACAAVSDWEPLPPGRSTSLPTIEGTLLPPLASTSHSGAEEIPPRADGSTGERPIPPLQAPIPSELPQLEPAATTSAAPPVNEPSRGSPEFAEHPLRRPIEPLRPEPEQTKSNAFRILAIAGIGAALLAGAAIVLIDRYLVAPTTVEQRAGNTGKMPFPQDTAASRQPSEKVGPPNAAAPAPAQVAASAPTPEPPAHKAADKGPERLPAARNQSVTFFTSPGGARIVVDGDEQLACTAPCELQLSPGRHSLTASLDGHREGLRIFRVPEDREVSLTLEERVGSLYISTNPAGAEVYVDGALQAGRTPLMLRLRPGTHKLRLSIAGRPDRETTITIRENAVSRFEVDWLGN